MEKQIEEMAVENLVAFLWHNTAMYDEDLIFDVAEAIYNAGYRKQEWISVEERLPDDHQIVVCMMKKGDFRVLEWDYPRWAWVDETVYWNERDVTHWMPLPSAPKGE